MTTRAISIDEEAYERLRAHRREGESFSDVVKRLARERSWEDVAGIWADEGEPVERAIEAGRERSRERRKPWRPSFEPGTLNEATTFISSSGRSLISMS